MGGVGGGGRRKKLTQLVRSTSANVSVMVLQGCKSSPQKSRPLESGHRRDVVCGIAIEYTYVATYKLGQKYEFKFLCDSWLVFAETVTYVTLSHLRSKGNVNDIALAVEC